MVDEEKGDNTSSEDRAQAFAKAFYGEHEPCVEHEPVILGSVRHLLADFTCDPNHNEYDVELECLPDNHWEKELAKIREEIMSLDSNNNERMSYLLEVKKQIELQMEVDVKSVHEINESMPHHYADGLEAESLELSGVPVHEGIYEFIESIQRTSDLIQSLNTDLQSKITELKTMLHEILPPGTDKLLVSMGK